MGKDTPRNPLVYQWDNILKVFLQKHFHCNKIHLFIALFTLSLQDILAFFFQLSLFAEQAGYL